MIRSAAMSTVRAKGALCFAVAAAAWALAAPGASAQVRFHGEAGGAYSVNVMSWRDIPFRTVVRQQYDYSCGSAAVATLMQYHYGVGIGEAEVFQAMFAVGDQARIREVGFSMLDMKNFLESRGFAADGLRLSLDRLASLDIPTIALITHEGYRHFVVVKGVRGDSVLVGDPTFGLQTYTREAFEAAWNGVVLAVRTPPQDVSAPSYNEAEEWRPWAVAPVGDAPAATPAQQLMLAMPELYQITAVREP